MARPKATDNGAEKSEAPQDKFDKDIRSMIDAMAQAVSSDMNEYQIQASILTRLAKWAKKRTGQGDEVMCPEWEDKYLPQYIAHISKVARAQHQKTAAYMASKKKDARKEFQDAAMIVPIGSVN